MFDTKNRVVGEYQRIRVLLDQKLSQSKFPELGMQRAHLTFQLFTTKKKNSKIHSAIKLHCYHPANLDYIRWILSDLSHLSSLLYHIQTNNISHLISLDSQFPCLLHQPNIQILSNIFQNPYYPHFIQHISLNWLFVQRFGLQISSFILQAN